MIFPVNNSFSAFIMCIVFQPKAYQKSYGCAYILAMNNGSWMLRNDKVKNSLETESNNRGAGCTL